MVNQSAPQVGDLVINHVTGQVFGVSERRKNKKGLFLVDEKGELQKLEDCDRISGAEVTQAEIDDISDMIDLAIETKGDDHLVMAVAVIEAIAAVCPTKEQKKSVWAGLRPNQREYLSFVKAELQQREAA